MTLIPDIDSLLEHARFDTSRSSGPGGQHVNKSETKVTLYFNIDASGLTEEQKKTIKEKCANRINIHGELFLSSMTSRSQHTNKEAVIVKLKNLLETNLVPKKKRHATSPPRASILTRLDNKKRNAEKKKWRQNPM